VRRGALLFAAASALREEGFFDLESDFFDIGSA